LNVGKREMGGKNAVSVVGSLGRGGSPAAKKNLGGDAELNEGGEGERGSSLWPIRRLEKRKKSALRGEKGGAQGSACKDERKVTVIGPRVPKAITKS